MIIHGFYNPKCSLVEQELRISEAKIILEHIFDFSLKRTLQILLTHKDTTTWIIENMTILHQPPLTQLTIDTLLAFKDRLTITDHDWPYIVEVIKLGSGATLRYVRQARNRKNDSINPQQVCY